MVAERSPTGMPAAAARFVRIYGLHVRDDARYAQYREHMMPLLRLHGGDFGYDMLVSRVLRSETEGPINRVFTMCFASRESADAFFSDPRYRAVRDEWFVAAVTSVIQIGEFEVRD